MDLITLSPIAERVEDETKLMLDYKPTFNVGEKQRIVFKSVPSEFSEGIPLYFSYEN